MAETILSCLCFSKDRAFQLDGYLRSVKQYFEEPVKMTVLYVASNPQFQAGFDVLKEKHPTCNFVAETDFGSQVLNWINEVKTPYIMYGCDDVIFCRRIDLQPIIKAFERSSSFGFSLRLGQNIRFTHTREKEVPKPEWIEQGHLLRWNWRTADADWGYPFELNGTIYPTNAMQGLFTVLEQLRIRQPQADWRHPNYMEKIGNDVVRAIGDVPSELVAFEQSSLVVPTINQVQEVGYNRLLGTAQSVEFLEEARCNGFQMDLAAYENTPFERIHVGEFFCVQKDCSEHQ